MLTVQHISKRFGDNHVLEDVSFSIEQGSIIGLVGPSGGGKSVLLKILGAVLEADCGTFHHPFCSREDVSLMFQEGALFDSLTVFENVAFPLVRGSLPVAASRLDDVADRVAQSLSHVGLLSASRKFPAQLSGGMRRRVSLARALVAAPKLVFLDDPTCGLDPVASSVIMDLIERVHSHTHATMIIAGHDLRRLLPICSRFMGLFAGTIAFYGTPAELAASDRTAIKEFVSCRYDLGVPTRPEEDRL